MRDFTLSVAQGVRQNPKNKTYSTQAVISCLEDLTQAVQFDHVAGLFKNNERSNDNFISADCLLMDCDNDAADAPEAWLTPEKLSERLKDVELAIIYSKSHMQSKDKYSPRPRFHVYLPLSNKITEAGHVRRLKETLLAIVPEFDSGAKDAARFFYGVEKTQGVTFEGGMCVDEFLAINVPDEPQAEYTPLLEDDSDTDTVNLGEADNSADTIHEGSRNDTLFRTALNLLRKYSEKKARDLYDKACAQCVPPLPMAECSRIWKSARGYVNDIEDRVKSRQRLVLTLSIVEKTLEAMNISVRYNVITKSLLVSDLPPENEHVPPSYYALQGVAKKQASAMLLPTFLTTYFKSQNYGVNDRLIQDGISAIATTHPLNPVAEIMKATAWDGKNRIADLYHVLGIDPQSNPIYCGLVDKWLHQAVALALNDDGSINAEFVLVLQGRQGIGKTAFFRALAGSPDLFKDGVSIDLRDKDSLIRATSTWLAELGELDATLSREQASLKAFLTSNADEYRRPYARTAEKFPRRTAFCGTVNPEKSLRDDTGSRRFVIIHVDDMSRDFIYNTMTHDWSRQLWRQVYETLYTVRGAKAFYLSDSERAFIEAENEQYSLPIDAEIELRDLLQWDSDIDTWEWQTISQIEARSTVLKDKRINSRKIAKALRKILSPIASKRGETVKDFTRELHGALQFYTPATIRQVRENITY